VTLSEREQVAFLALGFVYLEDGGDTFIRNVVSHKIYTAPHPRRRHSSRIKTSAIRWTKERKSKPRSKQVITYNYCVSGHYLSF
jgi:KaiC/GvpD/RAD55 family RecA-like ATPase